MPTNGTTIDSNPLTVQAPSADVQASPELQRALVNIRVVVAIMALLESLTLSLASRPAVILVVLGYAVYAGWLAWLGMSSSRPPQSRATAWIDAAWILLAAWLAATPSSLFILLLLFPTLFASLRFGFLAGLQISLFAATGASAVTYALHGGAASPEAMLFPLSILGLGPLVAALARAGLQRDKQLRITDLLLKQADPRLGVKRVSEMILRALEQHFTAERGYMLIRLAGGAPRLVRGSHDEELADLDGELLEDLLRCTGQLPREPACVRKVIHDEKGGTPERRWEIRFARERWNGEGRAALTALADRMELEAFLYVPICLRSPYPSWLLLEPPQSECRVRDADLLFRTMEQLSPVIENASLLEQLSDEAVATERARIGRDLHDTAIQPYLGLKYGIEALARRAQPDNPLYDSVRALQEMAASELQELREVVSSMRAGVARGESTLAPALRRQAKRFSELFGIEVTIECDDGIPVGRNQSAAMFHLISEALTNVRRHTHANRAEIRVTAEPDTFVLHIGNDHGSAPPPAPFLPRSISERAESLGGRVAVDLQRRGHTDVVISIPRPHAR